MKMKLFLAFIISLFALTTVQAQNLADTTVYLKVSKYPSYPGGTMELTTYLIKNQKYPASAKRDTLKGDVLLEFVVEKDGSLTDIKVVEDKGLSPDCDAEALRLVKAMPKWEPGTVGGQPVRCLYRIKIRFEPDPVTK